MLLAGIAAVIAIITLGEFFNIGNRVGLPAFRKWTMVCAFGIFYAQYSAGLVQTLALSGGDSLVRDATRGILSVEAVLLIFLFGAVESDWPLESRCTKVLPAVSISSAGLLFIALPLATW